MTMRMVLTFVSILLLQSMAVSLVCSASTSQEQATSSISDAELASTSQEQATGSISDADIDQLNPAPNTGELLQDIHVKMSAFQEQLERQALTIAEQELQIKELKPLKGQAEIIARQGLQIQSQRKELEEFKQLVRTQQETQRKELEEFKQLVMAQQETQTKTIMTQELQLQSQKKEIEVLKQLVMKQQEKQTATATKQELQLQSQKKEIEALKQLVRTQQETQAATIGRHELKLQSQAREIEGLKQLVTTQQETIDTHAKHMITQRILLKQQARKLKQPLDKMSNEITDMAGTIPTANKSSSRITRQVQSGNVAFSAYLNGDIRHLPGGYIIKMKGVNLNEGNAYNPSNGIFTTTHNGVYLFSFTVAEYNVHQTVATLVVDGSIMSTVISRPSQSGGDIQGTNVVLLRLTTGQQVWTEIDMDDSEDNVVGSSRWKLTTFSGVFLFD